MWRAPSREGALDEYITKEYYSYKVLKLEAQKKIISEQFKYVILCALLNTI